MSTILWTPSMSLADTERTAILAALKFHQWHRERTAQALGISLRNLTNKIKEYKEQGHQILDTYQAANEALYGTKTN